MKVENDEIIHCWWGTLYSIFIPDGEISEPLEKKAENNAQNNFYSAAAQNYFYSAAEKASWFSLKQLKKH